MGYELDHEASLLEARLFGGSDVLEDEHYARTQRLAAVIIRRQTNQHDCREKSTQITCKHPDHRRDRFYTHAMLEALGISRDHQWPTEEDYDLYLRQEVKSPNGAPNLSKRWGYADYGPRRFD